MKILIADDERVQREILNDILSDEGHSVVLAENGKAAIDIILKGGIGVVLTDLKMPKVDGLEVLKATMDFDPSIQVIIMTAFGSIPGAVSAIKMGAYDYLAKPFQKDDLLRVVRRATEKLNLLKENIRLRAAVEEKYSYGQLIGKSKAMKDIYRMIDRVKDVDATCLITGESGTGKELVAKAIHYNGHRKSGPFVALNCGAIPDNLIESELFGHRKGSFTGAINDSPGKFEQAQSGTIFLDEIGTMRKDLQVKLLRVLQERKVTPVGSSQVIPLNVRIIAATNLEMEAEVQNGNFRSDLFHRLNVFSIFIPPLRDRKEDIPVLANHFLKKYAEEYKKGSIRLSPEALKNIDGYHFPGNIRELENLLEKSIILIDGDEITGYSLALPKEKPAKNGDRFEKGLIDVEKQMIEEALNSNRGSINKACADLNISYKTLQYRISKYGIDKNRFKKR